MPEAESNPLLSLLALKGVPRTGWTRFPIPAGAVESVADHSFGVALLAWLLCPSELDRARVLEMALVHDLAEVVTGDLTPADGVGESLKKADEEKALSDLLQGFEARDRGLSLLAEYQGAETAEARFVKAVDKLDMGLQSLAYERAFGVDLEEFRESARARLGQAGLLSWLSAERPPEWPDR